jgi:Flp pilus assembly pilin Flp
VAAHFIYSNEDVTMPVRAFAMINKISGFGQRFHRNSDGVTAVEFGMVALPFLLFVLGTMAIGLQFFTINALDNAVETAARKIRTGEAQRAGMKLGEFKDLICQSGGSYIEKDCEKIFIHVESAGDWAAIAPRACASNGKMTAQSNMTADLVESSGGSEQVVLVTVCYDWQLPVTFAALQYMLMRPADGVALESGGSLVQSVATFRTEPYE